MNRQQSIGAGVGAAAAGFEPGASGANERCLGEASARLQLLPKLNAKANSSRGIYLGVGGGNVAFGKDLGS